MRSALAPPSCTLVLGCLIAAGCALDWRSTPADAGNTGDQGETEDGAIDLEDATDPVEIPDGDPPDSDEDSEDAVPAAGDTFAGGECSAETCGSGTCSGHGNCECEDGHIRDGEVCDLQREPTPEPDACHRPDAPTCQSGSYCQVTGDDNATCACDTGLVACSAGCVNLRTDRKHCGKCEYGCAGNLACEEGKCKQAVHELVLGDEATCALMEPPSATGAYPLKCWGSGSNGLFRTGDQQPSALPRKVEGVTAVRAIALAANRTCAITPDGTRVDCWGRCGQDCGLEDWDFSEDHATFHSFETRSAVRLSTVRGWDGFYSPPIGGNTCVLSASGELQCVGYAQFVTSGMNRHVLWPVSVETAANTPRFGDVSGDGMHTCAVLREDGRVACWGDAALEPALLGAPLRCPLYAAPEGSCTNEETVALHVLTEPAGDLTKAMSVRARGSLSCAVTSEHEAYCWGTNEVGQLGCGDAKAHHGAVKVAGVKNIVEVAVGGSFGCTRDETGQVYCWGSRASVGLGDDVHGDVSDGFYFSTPQAVPGLSDALDVWAGNGHACARRRNGEVLCWGANSEGELGIGDTQLRTTPTAVENLF